MSNIKNYKRFLIIIPAGDNSLHKYWYNSDIYDLYVIYFGDNKETEREYKKKADFFRKDKGPKWQLIRRTIQTFNINKYNYIWLPDDDLEINKNNLEEFLLISEKYQFKLSQPSLNVPNVSEDELIKHMNDWHRNIVFNKNKEYMTYPEIIKFNKSIQKLSDFLLKDNLNITKKNTIEYQLLNDIYTNMYKSRSLIQLSLGNGWHKWYTYKKNAGKNDTVMDLISKYISYKYLLQHYPKNQKIVRPCTFVEIMCPLIHINFFKKAFYLIDHDSVQSGFGLDQLWSIMLKHENIGVIDYISVIHTRPVGHYSKKKTGNFKVISMDPLKERELTFHRFLKYNYYFNNKTIKNFTLKKPKIAFLFLTKGDLNYPNIWEKYFSNNYDKINIYNHPKNTNDVKSFLKKYIIKNRVETKWGNISIVKAMSELLLEAFTSDGSNEYFVFRSESCLPLKNFNKFYNFIIKKNKSIVSLGNESGQHDSRFKYLKHIDKEGITKKNFYKGETWTILTRKHVRTILCQISNYLHIFKDVYVPEEHVNIVITILNHGIKSIENIPITLVYWEKEYSSHPYSFGPILKDKEKKYLLNNLNKNIFFGRKFIYDKENNVETFINNLI
jgi:hypothetical protein